MAHKQTHIHYSGDSRLKVQTYKESAGFWFLAVAGQLQLPMVGQMDR